MSRPPPKARKGTAESDLIVPNDPQSASFVQGLLARGEAARLDEKGVLPPGATPRSLAKRKTGFRSFAAVVFPLDEAEQDREAAAPDC